MNTRDWRLRLTRKNYVLLHNAKIMRRTANVSVPGNRPYAKMAALKLFFCTYKIASLTSFDLKDEASEAILNTDKTIILRPPS